MNTQSIKVLIDGVEETVPITNLDTIDSVKLYIAKKLKVPLKTIFVKKEQTQTVEDVDDLPFYSTQKITESTDITSMKLEFTTLLSPQKVKSLDLIKSINYAKELYPDEAEAMMYTFWFKYNSETADFIIEANSELYRSNIMDIFNFVEALQSDKYKSFSTINEFIRRYNLFYKKLKQDMEDQEKLIFSTSINQEYNKRIKEINKLIAQTTPSKLTHTVLKVVLSDRKTPTEKDIYEIFNNCNISTDVPYVSVGNFYKVLKGFKCPLSWVESAKEYNNNTIVLYVLNKYNYTKLTNKSTDFSKIIITIENNDIVILIDSKVDDYNKSTDLKEEQLLMRICDSLDLNYSKLICKIYPQEIKCSFYITDNFIKKILFLELCVNNRTCSSFFAANERYRIFNKKSSIQAILKQNNIVFQLQSLYVTYPVRKRVGSGVKIGENVVEIRVTSAKNLYDVESLKQYLALFISIYEENKECLEDIYKTYVSSFSAENSQLERLVEGKKIEAEKKEEKLKDIAPEIFVKGYPRKCTKLPKIISENEYEKLKKKKVDIMKYPLYGEYDETHYYSCQHLPNHPHPGLIKMEVNNQPHYAPCCFDVNQADKQTAFRYIYENEELEEDDKSGSSKVFKMTKTMKTLSINRLGVLTKNVSHFFRLIDPFNVYVRHFVPKGPKSLIAAVGIASKVKDINDKEVLEEYIEKIIKKMKKTINNNIGFQNAYDYNAESLKQLLDQDEKYLDIRLFSDLLESVTGYRIVFFTHNKKYPDGTFSSPNFAHNLLLNNNKTNKPHIILYETTGSASEKMQFPHYEIISIYNKQEKELYSVFNKDSDVVKEMEKLYKEIYLPFSDQTGTVIRNVPFENTIVQQHVDFFGKTRILYFENGINILTTPIDSIPLSQIEMVEGVKPYHKYLKQFKYTPIKYEKAIDFCKSENVSYKKIKVKNWLVGLVSVKGNINFYIPLEPEQEETENEKIQTLHSVSMIRESALEKFIKFEQISRQLLAHVLYHFSKYISKKDKKLTSENILSVIQTFSEDNTVVDETQESQQLYKDIPRVFEAKTSFIQNGKIVFTNQELQKRLMYSLYVEFKRGVTRLEEYKSRIYAPNFYQNIRDFKSSEDNVMFHSEKDIINWINSSSEPSQKIYDMFINEFVNEIKKEGKALMSSNLLNKISPNVIKDGVYECKKIVNKNVIGTVYVLNPNTVEVLGNGGDLHLAFKFDEEEYFLLLSRYQM